MNVMGKMPGSITFLKCVFLEHPNHQQLGCVPDLLLNQFSSYVCARPAARFVDSSDDDTVQKKVVKTSKCKAGHKRKSDYTSLSPPPPLPALPLRESTPPTQPLATDMTSSTCTPQSGPQTSVAASQTSVAASPAPQIPPAGRHVTGM